MLDRYDSVEFDCVEYMSSSGGLSCPDADARIAYIQCAGYPQLEFNGGSTISGAGLDAVNGSVYDPVVQGMLDDPTPVALTITDYAFSAASAFLTVRIELEGDLPVGSNMKLRVALVEDKLVYGGVSYQNILRDMLPDVPLTIDTAGMVQTETINFTWNPAWVAANFRAVAFVQDDLDRTVWQSCNTRPTPAYSLRYYAVGQRTVIGAGATTFGDVALFNTGLNADTYTVSLDLSGLPADGSAHFEYGGTQHTTASIGLAAGERAVFNVVVDPGTGYEGSVVLTLHSDSGQASDRQLVYKMISAGTDVLIVDDDGAYNYEDLYFAPALAGSGKSHAVWDRNSSAPTGEQLANFDIVVWGCGFAFPTIEASDRLALTEFLDGGGSLFITGQDIGWDLNDQGGAAAIWYRDYLHATFVSDDTNDLTLTGMAGTFTEGLALNLSGGDGANNQDYPSDIDPRAPYASTILAYDANRNGGIMVDTGVYKVVYLSFGFEAINNAADRAALMEGVIGFLSGVVSPVGESLLPGAMTLLGNAPNPFNPQTEINFTLATDTRVKLDVFDLRGRLVRTVADGLQPAGLHRIKWDGRDGEGREVPSGAYFYRLTGPDQVLTEKMMLVR